MPTIPFSEPPSVDESGRIQRIGRRAFILSAAGAVSAVAFWSLRRGTVAAASPLAKDDGPKMVTIIQFGADGKKIGKAAVPRLVKPDAEWQHQLSPAAYWVTRHADTERPFTGESLNEHRHGIFRCIGCDLALFSSETKFDSGTGWPSFWQPIARENVLETSDGSMGMERTAVSCRLCDAHLGHVFDDGPRPTGLRYCMNAVSMRFAPIAYSSSLSS
jgi:peptide-methionine (R)-S-oxide reductase